MAVITKTLKSSGGDYSLMSTWESTEQTNLVSDGDSHVLECYTFTCTEAGQVKISGWTTGASNTITIKPAAGEHHEGVIGDGFILSATAGYTGCFDIAQNYVTVQGISVYNHYTGAYGRGISAVSDYFTLDSLIVKGGSGYYTEGMQLAVITGFSSTRVTNCAVLQGTGLGINLQSYFYGPCCNNTVRITGEYGIRRTGHVNPLVLSNNVCVGATIADFSVVAGFTGGGNASGDSSALGSSPQTGIVTTTGVDFTDVSSDDFTPVSGGQLDGTGLDLSGTYTNDIAGETRATPYDIGAWKLVAGGGGGFKAAWAFGSNQII